MKVKFEFEVPDDRWHQQPDTRSLEDKHIAREHLNTLMLSNEVKATYCNCKYPDVAYRNGSGHAPKCPTHIQWKDSR